MASIDDPESRPAFRQFSLAAWRDPRVVARSHRRRVPDHSRASRREHRDRSARQGMYVESLAAPAHWLSLRSAMATRSGRLSQRLAIASVTPTRPAVAGDDRQEVIGDLVRHFVGKCRVVVGRHDNRCTHDRRIRPLETMIRRHHQTRAILSIPDTKDEGSHRLVRSRKATRRSDPTEVRVHRPNSPSDVAQDREHPKHGE